MRRFILTVSEDDSGERLDVFAAAGAGISRSAAQRLIEAGSVTVNGIKVPKRYELRDGDTVEVEVPEARECEAVPQDIPLDIVYEDDDIIIINKPSGMVVHPAAGNEDGTLVNALLYHCGTSLSGIGDVLRPGIVHRIDKDTSGLLAVAKNDMAHIKLSEQLKTHEMHRIYYAIVVGRVRDDAGTVNAPIGRHPKDRKRMAVIHGPNSREAITDYVALGRYKTGGESFSCLKLSLHTGRTHQIRVHMSYIGHPVAGDAVYGACKTTFERRNASLFNGQCLHAAELTLRHPSTNEIMTFTCPLPQNFQAILSKLNG
ncbi:MAG: RluA family pseudouridine synthase [Eubacteriales bacterium]|jgi:23S rRNA pseudouridine1911/1915/1917 synthase|nr:RluA family pseudouridine synthase [Clostridiales bacterium]